MTFKNKLERDLWISCLKHAENLDQRSGTMIEVKFHKSNYIEYADSIINEFRAREIKPLAEIGVRVVN